jgi:hypothetical protein
LGQELLQFQWFLTIHDPAGLLGQFAPQVGLALIHLAVPDGSTLAQSDFHVNPDFVYCMGFSSISTSHSIWKTAVGR